MRTEQQRRQVYLQQMKDYQANASRTDKIINTVGMLLPIVFAIVMLIMVFI